MKNLICLISTVLALLVLGATALTGQDLQVPSPPKDAQPDAGVVVPAGTVISIALSAYLNSAGSNVGDPFYADVIYPIYVQQRLVIPKGSTIRGTVTGVVRPGKVKGKGRIALRIDNILLPNGVNRDLVAVFHGIHGPGQEKLDRKSETVEGGGSGSQDVGTIAGTTAQGTWIGALGGRFSGKGAGIGAGAGAAAGLAMVLFTRGPDLVLAPGTQFDLDLKQPLRLAWNEVDFTSSQLNSVQRPSNPPRYPQQRQNQPLRRGGFPIPWIGIWP